MKPLSYYCNISPDLEQQVTELSPYDKRLVISTLAINIDANCSETPWSTKFSDLMNALAGLSYHGKLGLIIGLAHQLQPEL